MGDIISGRLAAASQITSTSTEVLESDIGVVFDVILDENNSYLKKINENLRLTFIGAVAYRSLNGFGVTLGDEPLALPYDATIKNLPTINEKVHIIKTNEGVFYKRIQPTNENPNTPAAINEISKKMAPKNNSVTSRNDVDKLKSVSDTNIADNSNSNQYAIYDKFGTYYKFQQPLHKLKLYEGDLLYETRFGQSIRFSAYNNPKKTFSPSIIIRNGESPLNQIKPKNQSIEENLNMDDSVIALTSNQYEIPFIPGTTDENGKSDFETKPESFLNYPSKLSGNQILLNSGRLIFSARNGEMIFYSKKNYGFISDGGLSIDNKLGIDINVRDGVNVITNDTDVVMFTGNGKIFLGSKDLEPMVKGKQLVQLLGELLDAIGDLQFKTPAGPSAIGSENRKVFESIKGKLNNVLSNLNQTA